MRLFIAINLNPELKNSLYDIIRRLKDHVVRGNFTRKENLHLTIVFLGETTRVDAVKQAMNNIEASPFTIDTEDLGCFPRRDGDIYWVGLARNNMLYSIYNQLCAELTKHGFAIATRAFRPHLTIGREVIFDRDFEINVFKKTIAPMSMEVNRISLMKSERIGGKLVYTEIYSLQLN
jgi:2'-5' RNA ligase